MANMAAGAIYFRKHPWRFWFLLATLMPFIIIMVTNYVFPIYVNQVLEAAGDVYGMSELLLAMGAMTAGWLIPLLVKRFQEVKLICITMGVFLAGSIIMLGLPNTPVFLGVAILLGFGNAGSRVLRNTLLMKWVPKNRIGRVHAVLRVIGLGIRIILIGLFTEVIHRTSIFPVFIVFVSLIGVSLLVVINCSKFNHTYNSVQGLQESVKPPR